MLCNVYVKKISGNIYYQIFFNSNIDIELY